MPRAQNKSKPTAGRTPVGGKLPPDPPLYAQCPDCPWSFPRMADLERHAIQHLTREERDSMMLECPYAGCSHKTLQKSNLRTHIRVKHSLERPYACSECSYTTADQSCLRRHQQSHHYPEEIEENEPVKIQQSQSKSTGTRREILPSPTNALVDEPVAIQLPKLWSPPTVELESLSSDSESFTPLESNSTWTPAYPPAHQQSYPRVDVFPSDSSSSLSYPVSSSSTSWQPSQLSAQWDAFHQYQGFLSHSPPTFESVSVAIPPPQPSSSSLALALVQPPTPAPGPALQYPGAGDAIERAQLHAVEGRGRTVPGHARVSMGYSQLPVHVETSDLNVSAYAAHTAMVSAVQPLHDFANLVEGYSYPPSQAQHEFEPVRDTRTVQSSFDNWQPTFTTPMLVPFHVHAPTPSTPVPRFEGEWGTMFSTEPMAPR
ncbi:hypothetical protein C8F01DRAFT_364796 [Mycena amicta]|nr:hypothetical protein C8F01DRAFT_364796 [Mycena amicta]